MTEFITEIGIDLLDTLEERYPAGYLAVHLAANDKDCLESPNPTSTRRLPREVITWRGHSGLCAVP